MYTSCCWYLSGPGFTVNIFKANHVVTKYVHVLHSSLPVMGIAQQIPSSV